MKTDVIKVSGQKKMMEAAIGQADKVAAYKGLPEKEAMHLRLLTEEMMGLMQSVTGTSDGEFWIEDEDGEYRLHLQGRTTLSAEKKEQLLSVSASGKNESAKGLMGRLREFFDWGDDGDVGASSLFLPEIYEQTSSPMLDWEWSMRSYEGRTGRAGSLGRAGKVRGEKSGGRCEGLYPPGNRGTGDPEETGITAAENGPAAANDGKKVKKRTSDGRKKGSNPG